MATEPFPRFLADSLLGFGGRYNIECQGPYHSVHDPMWVAIDS